MDSQGTTREGRWPGEKNMRHIYQSGWEVARHGGSSPHTAGEKSRWAQGSRRRPTEGSERWAETHRPLCTCQLLDRAEMQLTHRREEQQKDRQDAHGSLLAAHFRSIHLLFFASVKVMHWGRITSESANPRSPHRLCHILLGEQGVHHL